MMKNKDKAVTILTKGVEFLLKKIKLLILKELEASNLKMKFLIKDDQKKETVYRS